jgi:hypothetical protein
LTRHLRKASAAEEILAAEKSDLEWLMLYLSLKQLDFIGC